MLPLNESIQCGYWYYPSEEERPSERVHLSLFLDRAAAASVFQLVSQPARPPQTERTINNTANFCAGFFEWPQSKYHVNKSNNDHQSIIICHTNPHNTPCSPASSSSSYYGFIMILLWCWLTGRRPYLTVRLGRRRELNIIIKRPLIRKLPRVFVFVHLFGIINLI